MSYEKVHKEKESLQSPHFSPQTLHITQQTRQKGFPIYVATNSQNETKYT